MNDSQYMIDSLNDILSGLSIKATCIDAVRRRHIGFYDVKLSPGERVRSIESKATEIALHLKSKTNPVIKLIREEGVVRVQAVFSNPETIPFDSLYANTTVRNGVPKGFLPFLVGETHEGDPLWVDMAEHPHTLVAGETGSGKSVFLHLLIANAAQRKDTKLYLIDPKRVEFSNYSKSKLITHISHEYSDTIATLKNLVSIMEQRYSLMAQMRMKSIKDAPSMFEKIVVIIDEAADLVMQQDKKEKEFESLVVRLAQKSRAAGIYLVLATQRPSVDVITGLIKANFPARIAFKVASKSNSRVIMDANGAETLLGKGDGIIKSANRDYIRFQGAFV